MSSRTKKRSVPTEKRCFNFSMEQLAQLEQARQSLGVELNLTLTDTAAIHQCIKRYNELVAERRKATERAG